MYICHQNTVANFISRKKGKAPNFLLTKPYTAGLYQYIFALTNLRSKNLFSQANFSVPDPKTKKLKKTLHSPSFF